MADGTIYLYFKNKDDILTSYINYKNQIIFSRFVAEIEKGESSFEKLQRLVRCHLEEFQRDIDMAVVFQAETRQIHHCVERINDMSKQYRRLLSDIIELGQEEGCFRRDLYIGLVKRFIIGSLTEVINTWVLSGGKYDLVSMADPLVDLFVRGIGSAPVSVAS